MVFENVLSKLDGLVKKSLFSSFIHSTIIQCIDSNYKLVPFWIELGKYYGLVENNYYIWTDFIQRLWNSLSVWVSFLSQNGGERLINFD